MTEKKSTTHVLIPKQLLIAQRERSSVWQCRYCIDNRWQRTSTGERDIEKAKLKAHELLMEANVRKRMNVAPITRYFKDVAQHAIKRMKDELSGGGGKVSYKDYIVATEKYLIQLKVSFARVKRCSVIMPKIITFHAFGILMKIASPTLSNSTESGWLESRGFRHSLNTTAVTSSLRAFVPCQAAKSLFMAPVISSALAAQFALSTSSSRRYP